MDNYVGISNISDQYVDGTTICVYTFYVSVKSMSGGLNFLINTPSLTR